MTRSKEMKRRTEQFANHFRNVDPAAVEPWLLARACCKIS